MTVMTCGKIFEIAGNPLSCTCYNVTREGERECFKKVQIRQSAAKPFASANGRFRDYNEEFPRANYAQERGIVHADMKVSEEQNLQTPVRFRAPQQERTTNKTDRFAVGFVILVL